MSKLPHQTLENSGNITKLLWTAAT